MGSDLRFAKEIVMKKRSIPVNTPVIGDEEKANLIECVETGWISSEGPFVAEFENRFSDYIGRKHGVAVSNGSAALDVAVAALNMNPGDEIIVPTFTIISPLLSIVRSGLKPVLVDSNLENWNMQVGDIASKITSKTRAILVVHIYGLPTPMDEILELCNRNNLYLIEDAAEVHGQTYKGQKCGSFGDISTFSFYPNKIITSGEGGMCLTNSAELADRCRKLRNLAFEPNGRRFVHEEIGWNYRMTNLQAAVGLAQLDKIDQHLTRKKEIGFRYLDGLRNVPGLTLPLRSYNEEENIFWVFGVICKTEEQKEALCKGLNDLGIGTRPFFWCMHEQPVFLKKGMFEGFRAPNAELMSRRGFYLPSGIGLVNSDIDFVCKAVSSLILNNEAV